MLTRTSYMNRSPLKRLTALKKGKLKQLGKRGRTWSRIRASLKKEFLARGITACEIRFPGCARDNMLSFAHSRKRRFIQTDDQWREVALANTLQRATR